MTELGAIFSQLGLGQYLDVFVTEGFETWNTVLDITESDLYDVSLFYLAKYDGLISSAMPWGSNWVTAG